MSVDHISDLLGLCERRLLESLRLTEEVIDQVREARRHLAESGAGIASDHGAAASLTEQQRQIVEAVLTAMGSGAGPLRRDLLKLARHDADGTYRIGRRRLNLTETETQIMDLFWHAAPDPVSREAIHAGLYPGEDKPSAGVIDVFLSKLRQKLKLASDGREYVESIRGKGWGLRVDLCQLDEAR